MWRLAAVSEDDDIIAMSRELYSEDPSPLPVPEQHTRATLSILRKEPVRGCALVLDLNETIAGYALLISFWSNELGGEVVVIDELYIGRSHRRQGYGRGLLFELARENTLWPRQAVALELEVTPQNARAASLYSSVGFTQVKNSRLRYLRLH
jgi:GNAT superfamily N-acetyltransferase